MFIYSCICPFLYTRILFVCTHFSNNDVKPIKMLTYTECCTVSHRDTHNNSLWHKHLQNTKIHFRTYIFPKYIIF